MSLIKDAWERDPRDAMRMEMDHMIRQRVAEMEAARREAEEQKRRYEQQARMMRPKVMRPERAIPGDGYGWDENEKQLEQYQKLSEKLRRATKPTDNLQDIIDKEVEKLK